MYINLISNDIIATPSLHLAQPSTLHARRHWHREVNPPPTPTALIVPPTRNECGGRARRAMPRSACVLIRNHQTCGEDDWQRSISISACCNSIKVAKISITAKWCFSHKYKSVSFDLVTYMCTCMCLSRIAAYPQRETRGCWSYSE